MKTEYLKVLHERALNILDLIKRCAECEREAVLYLEKYDKANWLDLIQIINTRAELVKRVDKYTHVRQRLTKAYLNTNGKIQAVAIEYIESKKVATKETSY